MSEAPPPSPEQPAPPQDRAPDGRDARMPAPPGSAPGGERSNSFRPILSDRSLRRFHGLFSRPPVRAGVGIVLVNVRGEARPFPPHRQPTVGELVWAGSGTIYEVDMGVNHTDIELQLPAEEDAFAFPVVAHLEWQVLDAAQVVRDGVRDVRVMFGPLLYQVLADQTRGVPVRRPAEAEKRARDALAGVDLARRYGIQVGVILKFRTDEPSVGHATARREAEHELELEMLRQKVREAQELHNNVLVSARVDMYRGIISRGDMDQFALQLAQRPDDVASVVQLMRDERDEKRKQVTDFVLQLLNSGAVERWEVDDQVRAALSWLKESTENIIAAPTPDRLPAGASGGARAGGAELPGGAALPRAGRPGQDTGKAIPPSPQGGTDA